MVIIIIIIIIIYLFPFCLKSKSRNLLGSGNLAVFVGKLPISSASSENER